MKPQFENFITLDYALEQDPPPFEDNFIKSPESLMRYFIRLLTKPGDSVFDPFSGLGTTLFVAEAEGRIPFGIEADRKRFEWTAGQLENWGNVVYGDSGELASYRLPKMNFCMTSPPFMPRYHQWNPLYAGNPDFAGYDAYLARMGDIWEQVAGRLKKGAYAVVQVDNLDGPTYTPLIRDMSLVISKSLRLDGEVTVAWRNPPRPDYQHTNCLIFKKP